MVGGDLIYSRHKVAVLTTGGPEPSAIRLAIICVMAYNGIALSWDRHDALP